MKKIALGCGGFLILSFSLVAFVFYYLSLPKYRDVSNEEPFSEIVNKTLITKKEVLILQHTDVKKDENYLFHLEDGNHYGMDSGLEVIAALPIGTAVTIDKVELHTNRVSGTTSAYLFGKAKSHDQKEEYTFQCNWGDHHVLYEDIPYWTFNTAFWQDKPLTKQYIIKAP